MTQIVAHYMKLVPTFAAEGHHTLPNGSTIDFDDSRFHSILFGGDQLTVARIRGTQTLRDTQERKVDRLEGVVPVCEDWHTRMTLLKVLYMYVKIIHYTVIKVYTSMWGNGGLLCILA